MSPENAELLARISAFDIDGGDVPLPFAARLARENGWSRAYAGRVIEEYKRFVFLAVTGDSPVCPSEDVDAAWHLHLTYTRSYWKRFCGEVLGHPLHHDPTKGGPAEGEKHLKMYAATLAAYRAAFGQSAPHDIWPAGAERFGDDMKHRAVNTSRNWVIPKAPVKRIGQLVAAFAVVALLLPGCEGGLDPFALKNNDFLITLGLSLVAAVFVGWVLRSMLRTPHPRPDDENAELDWEQTAYLAGGAGRLTTAAIARLFGRGLVRLDGDDATLVTTGTTPDDTSPVERAVLGSLPVKNERTALKPVQDAVEAAFAPRAARMEEDGLTLSLGSQLQIWFASLLPVLLVLLCLATPRLVMGMQGNHPVRYLVIEMIIGGVVGLLAQSGSLRLSNRGVAMLDQQKKRRESLRTGTQWESGSDAGMAVALFGTAVLAGTVVAPLQTWYPRQISESSSGGCSTGCGSGCSGGDGGGGGCGGGGCGGGGD
jgi:uncharacterized protein (TIGR04222 family)